MRTALIDYGGGNLHSVEKALARAGLEPEVCRDPERAAGAEVLVLPGQGHFGQVMRTFLASGFEPAVRDHIARDRPFLGICVGLQILTERSEEAPGVDGLGIVPGTVRRFPRGASVPQMGWNQIERIGEPPLLDGISDGAFVYFANSYYVEFGGDLAGARTRYGGVTFRSAVSRGNLHATQFHPEKSQRVGLRLLENFRRVAERAVARAATP